LDACIGISFEIKYLPTIYSLLVYLSSCFTQETAKWPLRSSSQAATRYHQSNHSKVEAIPLSALPKDTTSELAGLISSHFPF